MEIEPIQLEFLGPAWLDALLDTVHAAVQQAGATLDGARFSMCEVVTEVPAHLTPRGTTNIAWWLVIDGGQVEAGLGTREGIGYRAEATYEQARAAAKRVLRARTGTQIDRTNGSDRLSTIPDAVGAVLLELHNQLARRTR
jgi:hypothetical protein